MKQLTAPKTESASLLPTSRKSRERVHKYGVANQLAVLKPEVVAVEPVVVEPTANEKLFADF
jgi:hypothetical protein